MLVHLLDRPGGRALLARIGTRVLRKAGAGQADIMYRDGFWTRRIGPHFFPDSLKFRYTYEDFSSWPLQMERYISDAREHWLRYYQPNEGDVIVDVGAGRGEDTVAFSKVVGKTGRVIAIEAHPLSFAILRSFCHLNRLENVTALNLALMGEPGAVRIGDSKDSWQLNSIENGDRLSGTEVRAATLSEVCERECVGKIAFVKMNIEGAERHALPGIAPVMSRIRHICVACHDFRFEMGHGEQFRTRDFVEQFLLEHGFALTSRKDDPREYVRDHVFGLNRELQE
jgi:FkbM family methyltransferase